MKQPEKSAIKTWNLGGEQFVEIKPRLRKECVVAVSLDNQKYGRIGPKEIALLEQNHTMSLSRRGFPVPEVLGYGELPDGKWFFTETSVGTEPFHKKFAREYTCDGKVSDETFGDYLGVMSKYADAQTRAENKSSISPTEFINTLFTENMVEWNYSYFGYSDKEYQKALNLAVERLKDAPMGIIQHDLNPYNVMERGIIDFELYGFGPIGYDTLISARWGGGWFTDYESRYPVAYKTTRDQIAHSDKVIDDIAAKAGLERPSKYLEEFLLIKSAWAVSDWEGVDPSWPKDKMAFRQFRARVLNSAVKSYLKGEPIDYWNFSKTPIEQISIK